MCTFSRYIFNIFRPGLTSAIIFMPISYLAHEYFQIETPFNNYINGENTNKLGVNVVQTPSDNNI